MKACSDIMIGRETQLCHHLEVAITHAPWIKHPSHFPQM